MTITPSAPSPYLIPGDLDIRQALDLHAEVLARLQSEAAGAILHVDLTTSDATAPCQQLLLALAGAAQGAGFGLVAGPAARTILKRARPSSLARPSGTANTEPRA